MGETMKVSDITVSDNVRIGELNLPDSFVFSIKELGIIQPLVVDETGQLIAGHRRLAGAIEVGLVEVPVVVRSSLTSRTAVQVVENLHRESLKDWELAQATLTLKDEGFKQAEIANVLSISKAEVSRLQKAARVDLPDDIGKQFTIDGLIEIDEVVKEYDRVLPVDVARLFLDAGHSIHTAALDASREVQAADAYDELATLHGEWKELGVIVVTDDPRYKGNTDAYGQPKKDGNVVPIEGYGGLGVELVDHMSEPCHVIYLYETGHNIKFPKWTHYCVNKNRHSVKGLSDLKIPKGQDAGSGMSDDEKEQRRKDREAKKLRYRQAGQFLQSSGNKAERYDIAVLFALDTWRVEDTRTVVLSLITAGKIDPRPKGAEFNWYDKQLKEYLDGMFGDDTAAIRDWKMRALLAHQYVERPGWGANKYSELWADLAAITIEESE